MGQLTEKGAVQLEELGKRLRRICGDAGFLDDYMEQDVYVRSTETRRTQHSVAKLLKGLFPTTKSIPVHIHADRIDPLHPTSIR